MKALSTLLAVTAPEQARYVGWLVVESCSGAASVWGTAVPPAAPPVSALVSALERVVRPPVDSTVATPLARAAGQVLGTGAGTPLDAEAVSRALLRLVAGEPRTALLALREVLRCAGWREGVAASGAVEACEGVLALGVEEGAGRQVQRVYEALYCLWLLSFTPTHLVQTRLTAPKLLATLAALLRKVKKAKVVRLVLAVLRNVTTPTRPGSGPALDQLLAQGVARLLPLLEGKNKVEWGDEDLADDLAALSASLEAHVAALSTWAQYQLELQGGRLDWTPSHRSERFWQDNFLQFESGDGAPLKQLRALLGASSDGRTLEVACWDVGELVRVHPRGRLLAQQLELQGPVMRLLSHPEEGVRAAALLALQKLLVQNWEYLATK